MNIEEIKDVDLKWVHVGQYHPYGDTHRVCEIRTKNTLDNKDILLLVKHDGTPSKEEFDSKQKTMSEYFAGYYTIEKKDYGYVYEKVEPYDD